MDYCFLTPDGRRFRVALPFRPYFYVATREDGDRELREASAAIQRRYGNRVVAIEPVKKNDLDAVCNTFVFSLFALCERLKYIHIRNYFCLAKPLDWGLTYVSQVIFRLSRRSCSCETRTPASNSEERRPSRTERHCDLQPFPFEVINFSLLHPIETFLL